MVEDPNWGRLELLKRRLVHRAGGATWLPPEDFGPSAIKSARFSLCNCALWLTLALVSWVMESLVADSPADEDRMVLFARLICRTSTYSLFCFMLGYGAARFKNWTLLKAFIYAAGLMMLIVMVAVMLECLMGLLGIWTRHLGDWLLVLGFVHTLCMAMLITLTILMNPLHDELDPRRRRSAYNRQRRHDRNQRRRRERERQAQAQAGVEPAVAPPRGDGGAVTPHVQVQALTLLQFLTTVHMEAYHDAISATGASTLEDLLTLDEQTLVAQPAGMRPLEVRRMKRIAGEHLQQLLQQQQEPPPPPAQLGVAVGFTLPDDEPPRQAAGGGGLSAGLLGDAL
jgi:small-conductance mechanosensitive channel